MNSKKVDVLRKGNASPSREIPLTREQFERLLKLVYLGNWMVNAIRADTPDDPKIEEYDEVEQHMLSLAGEFGFGDYVDAGGAARGKLYPSRILEEDTDVARLRVEYDEDTFWEELISRLGDRDFHMRHPKAEIMRMSEEERFCMLGECEDRWAEEVEQYGIDRIGVLYPNGWIV